MRSVEGREHGRGSDDSGPDQGHEPRFVFVRCIQVMSTPTEADVDYAGQHAGGVMKQGEGCRCADAPQEQVREALQTADYPQEKIHFVSGKVEETMPDPAPETICVLRLNADRYKSTKQELKHLFPRFAKIGVIIIDDYGHWQGSRRRATSISRRIASRFC